MYLKKYIIAFPDLLRFTRKRKKLTQVKLAELLNQSTNNPSDAGSTRIRISNWERGINVEILNLQEFLALCDILEVEADYFLGMIDTPYKITSDVIHATGLTEEASNALIYAKVMGHENLLDFINDLLEGFEINILAVQYAAYKEIIRPKPIKQASDDSLHEMASRMAFDNEYKFTVTWHDFLKATEERMKVNGKKTS